MKTSNFVLSIFMLLTILIALQFKDSKSYKTFSGPVTIYVTNNLTDNLQIVKTNIVILGIESYILKKVTSSPLSLRPLYQLNYTFVVFHELLELNILIFMIKNKRRMIATKNVVGK
jgi:hypothetical protein